MKPSHPHQEEFDDAALDDLFARARHPAPQDSGAAQRFLDRQQLGTPYVGTPHLGTPRLDHPPLTLPTPPAPLPERRQERLRHWWTPLLAAAALLGGVLVLRPTPAVPVQASLSQPLLASSAAYDAYASALGSGW